MEDVKKQDISHKGKKPQKYSLAIKKDAIEYAETNGNRLASQQFQVDVRRIREWRRKKNEIIALLSTQSGNQLTGGGRKDISHKGKKLQKYSLEIKKDAIEYAETNGNRPASRQFQVDERRIRDWRRKKNEIIALLSTQSGNQRHKLTGGGRKPTCGKLEKLLLEWINSRRSEGLRVSAKLIMKKAEMTFRDLKGSDGVDDANFKASRSWVTRFLKRNNLSLWTMTPVAQQDSEVVSCARVILDGNLTVTRTEQTQVSNPFKVIALDPPR